MRIAAVFMMAMSFCFMMVMPMESLQAKALRWAVYGSVEPIHRKLAQNFAKEHRGWTVTPIAYMGQSELLDMMLSKKPDVISLPTKLALEYIEIGILADLRQFYKGRERFYEEVMSAYAKNFVRKGKTFALPFWGNMATLNYNKALFAKAGYPKPQPGWRYENEFHSALRKLTKDANGDKRPEQWGMVGGVHAEWLPLFYSWGAEFLSMDGLKLLFTDRAAMESLTFIQRLHLDRLAEARDPDLETEPQTGPFIDGRTAMFIDNRMWDAAVVKRFGTTRPIDVAYTSTPYGKKGNISVASSHAIGIYCRAPKKIGASLFIKYLFEIDTQVLMYREGGGFPTRKNVLGIARLGSSRAGKAKSSKGDAIAKAYEKARVMGADEVSQLILDSVDSGIYEMVHQGVTPAQLMEYARDAFYQMVKEKVGRG